MKLITLNTWGGRAGKGNLLDFLKTYENVDFLCLQEIYSFISQEKGLEERLKVSSKSLEELKIVSYNFRFILDSLLEGKKHIFHPHVDETYGLMSCFDNGIEVVETGDIFVYKTKGVSRGITFSNHPRNIQFIKFLEKGKLVTVVNFHGLWNGQGKTDTDDRILQSQNILNFLEGLKKEGSEIIFAGDFNLEPDTESLKMFEDFGLRNLVKEYAVTSTRTSFYTKPGKYADYIFVSSGITVNDFKVLPDEVSDHSPLYLDFEI